MNYKLTYLKDVLYRFLTCMTDFKHARVVVLELNQDR